MTSELLPALAVAGTRLATWLVPMTLATALVLAAVWIADLALRRRVSARWRMLLFAAVLVRLALPPGLVTPRDAPRAHDKGAQDKRARDGRGDSLCCDCC